MWTLWEASGTIDIRADGRRDRARQAIVVGQKDDGIEGHGVHDPFAVGLSDAALVAEVTRLAGQERHATAALIASLAEFDARRLYLPAGCSSLFTYCTQVLHLSEHAAYRRIEAARAARRFPVILERLADGSITLTTVCLLGPLLTAENCDRVLEAAQHKSKRDVERLVARLRPQPAVPSSVRKLPQSKASQVRGVPQDSEAAPVNAQPVSPPFAMVSEPDWFEGFDPGSMCSFA